jgi:hypothetical protein
MTAEFWERVARENEALALRLEAENEALRRELAVLWRSRVAGEGKKSDNLETKKPR